MNQIRYYDCLVTRDVQNFATWLHDAFISQVSPNKQHHNLLITVSNYTTFELVSSLRLHMIQGRKKLVQTKFNQTMRKWVIDDGTCSVGQFGYDYVNEKDPRLMEVGWYARPDIANEFKSIFGKYCTPEIESAFMIGTHEHPNILEVDVYYNKITIKLCSNDVFENYKVSILAFLIRIWASVNCSFGGVITKTINFIPASDVIMMHDGQLAKGRAVYEAAELF